MLDKQIAVYSVDTGNFYSNHEARLHWLNYKLRKERRDLLLRCEKLEKHFLELDIGITEDILKAIIEYENVENKLNLEKLTDEEYNKLAYDFETYREYKELLSSKNKKIKASKEELLRLLENKINENIKSNGKHHIRQLNENNVSEKNIINVFDSILTRTIKAEPNKLCEDFMVIQVYYFDVIKDLIYYGFEYKGERYIYFTSSAGQIRTKKCVFIKESVFHKYQKTIMCGLTIDKINEKGGNNPNKHLAYTALTNSATDEWKAFDIDKTIVVEDFETNVLGEYDLIDDMDYSIKRTKDYVPIPHTDGCGMILPTAFGEEQKNFMIRLSWVKGLLGVFDYVKFIKQYNCSPIVKDIYGIEHDVIKEDIQIIFTKSQFKMWKYYNSWEEYKEYFKTYKCQAGKAKIEEDKIGNATINYQMLQTLTDITEEEIEQLVSQSNQTLRDLTDSTASIKRAFGINEYAKSYTYFQKAIQLYTNLLNDEYTKLRLRVIKDSLAKKFKAGKLKLDCKYTFLMPDLFAFCEFLFLGIENPKGLLEDGEVYCDLYPNKDKLDCLRSPHLFMEHAVRNNIAFDGVGERKEIIAEWFTTKACYTSTHDLISKILMFDCDGDTVLVVADKTIIQVAERNIKKFDIVPLYYNMRKASAVQLTNENIYTGLCNAFTGGNIGIYSNDISKIWNSETFISGSFEEQKEAIDIIKLLCLENNFTIDYAKTLYKPTRPDNIDVLIKQYTTKPIPHFFKYAKDKELEQIDEWNESFVNKLDKRIIKPRLRFKHIGIPKVDYKVLVTNPDIDCGIVFDKDGKIDMVKTNPMIVKYLELSRTLGYTIINGMFFDIHISEIYTDKQLKMKMQYQRVVDYCKTELSQFGYSEQDLVDILVKTLYHLYPTHLKQILWLCYGDCIFANMLKNRFAEDYPYKMVKCVDCGTWYEASKKANNSCRCSVCHKEYTRIQNVKKKRAERARKKASPLLLNE